MDPKIKLLPAKIRHGIEMRRLNEQYLTENYPPYFWKEYILYKNSFVLTKGSVVYGYILCGNTGDICSFCVDGKYRNRGYGSMLLDAAIAHLSSKYTELSLQVRQSNHNAIRLYESRGFVRVEEIHGYYEDGEDAYLMKLCVKKE